MPAVKSPDESSDELEQADTVDGMRSPEATVRNGGHWSESPDKEARRMPAMAAAKAMDAVMRREQTPTYEEPRGTVWIGAGEFPAP